MNFSKLRDMPAPPLPSWKTTRIEKNSDFLQLGQFSSWDEEPSGAWEVVTKEEMVIITWNFGGRQQVLKGSQSFVLDSQKEEEEEEGNNISYNS